LRQLEIHPNGCCHENNAYLCLEQSLAMKVEFEKKYLRELYETGKTADKKHRYQPQVINGYLKCVKSLIKVVRMEDLFLINSLNYQKLKGNKQGLSSVRINDQYRLEFREITNSNDTLYVEICSLVDITNHYK
jgi:proteic killer suppression protein